MIVAALGVSEVYISIRKDHAYGWQPTVVSSPGDSIGYQRRVEEIANRLRFQFDLREWHPSARSDDKQKDRRRRSTMQVSELPPIARRKPPLIWIQRLGAREFRDRLFLVDRAQHSSLGFVGDLLQECGLSLVWFSES
jgi:hypothetical protein